MGELRLVSTWGVRLTGAGGKMHGLRLERERETPSGRAAKPELVGTLYADTLPEVLEDMAKVLRQADGSLEQVAEQFKAAKR